MATSKAENETSADGVKAVGKAVATVVHEVTQGVTTAPPLTDAAGHLIDEYGLPLAGPLRVPLLAELGHPDPRDVDAWGLPHADPYRAQKLASLGKRDPVAHPADWS